MSRERSGRGPPEGHPVAAGRRAARRHQGGGVAVRRGGLQPLHLQGVHRRPLRLHRRVPGGLLRRRPGQLRLPALLHGRGDVPALRERQAGVDAELPEVVADRDEGRRPGVHDRPPGNDLPPEHARALQVPPRFDAGLRHREQREPRGGHEEVDGAQRRERPAGDERAVRHPEQPEEPARSAQGAPGPGRDGEEGSRREADPGGAGEGPREAEGVCRRPGHDREVARDGAAARRGAQLRRQRVGAELAAVHAGAPDRARGLQPGAGRRRPARRRAAGGGAPAAGGRPRAAASAAAQRPRP